jgi:hypothetical protein
MIPKDKNDPWGMELRNQDAPGGTELRNHFQEHRDTNKDIKLNIEIRITYYAGRR